MCVVFHIYLEYLQNPMQPVKNVRTDYHRFYQKNIKMVEVQFGNEDPAWIPYDTLLAMMESKKEQWK